MTYKGAHTARDKYGFEVGSARNQIAVLLDQGLSVEQIVAKKFLKQNIYAVRHAMKKAKGTPLDARFQKTRRQRNPELLDQWGIALSSRRHHIALQLHAGKTTAELIAAGEGRANVYSADKIMRAADAKLPVPSNGKATPLKKRKANGHAPAASNGNGSGFDIPMVEAILHMPNGELCRVFSPPDVFPQIYARAAKASGFI